MPELPEVETVRSELEPVIVGAEIVDGWGHGSAKFAEAIEAVGSTITGISRRGKYLLIGLDDDRELIVHLGMTGMVLPHGDVHDPYVRAWWQMRSGRTRWPLVFRDVRRFGRIRVVPVGQYADIATLAALGPEPLTPDFTPEHLHRAIGRSNRFVKTQLLSQRPVAGVGNIYADEALWRAGIRPRARTVTKPQAERLHRALVDVLEAAVANRGTTLRDYRRPDGSEGDNQRLLDCYGRWGKPCVRCGSILRKAVVDARTTTWCAQCQR